MTGTNEDSLLGGMIPHSLVKGQSAIVYLTVASVVLLIAAVQHSDRTGWWHNGGHDNRTTYSFIVAIVSLLISGVIFLLSIAKADSRIDHKLFSMPKLGDCTLRMLIAAFLVIWWAVAAAILTFVGPFVFLGNAYFALWAGLIASLVWFELVSGVDATPRVFGPALALLLCSATLLYACLSKYDVSQPEVAWGVTLGAISTAFSALLCLAGHSLSVDIRRALALLLVLLWIPGAGVLTFDGPFTVAGNGYFASWLGLLSAVSLALEQF